MNDGRIDDNGVICDDGGVIVMKSGVRATITPENCEEVTLGVLKSLYLTHQAGFCHCDIRKSNIVKFDQEYQLIDYDNAIEYGKEFTFKFGDLYDNRGYRLRSCKVGEKVPWTFADDYEMLMALRAKIYRPTITSIAHPPSSRYHS